jgi:hypothetical protein
MQPLRPAAMALLLSIASFGSLVHAHDHHGGESHIPEGEAILTSSTGQHPLGPHPNPDACIWHHIPNRHGLWCKTSWLCCQALLNELNT